MLKGPARRQMSGTMGLERVFGFSTRLNRGAGRRQTARQAQLPSRPIDLTRSLFLLNLLIFFALAPVGGTTSGATAATGNEKAIVAGADQHGGRVERQVAAETSDCGGDCQGEQQTVERKLDHDIETGASDPPAEVDQELDEEEQDESSELSPESRLYITVMRLIEGEGAGELQERSGSRLELPGAAASNKTAQLGSPALASEATDKLGKKLSPMWAFSNASGWLSSSEATTAATPRPTSEKPRNNGDETAADDLELNNDQLDAAPNLAGSSRGAMSKAQLEYGQTRWRPAPQEVKSQHVGSCLVKRFTIDKNQRQLFVFEWTCARLKRIDRNVTAGLEPKPDTLRLTWADFESLPADALQPCRETLRDFYIFQAPRLVSLDLVITGRHPDLTHIRIQQTGLRTWPDLSEFQQERLLTSIDLDNNRIESLGSKPLNIRAEVVNLEFNQISSIGEHTFNGSEIGTLSLSGNRQLSSVHPNAFANLKSLIKLYLSSTSLTQLPGVGLHQLRLLKVEDNYALKQIPSIFVFPMLEEAQMTYSFHCCSFRYPKTHDPFAYEEHFRIQNQINAVCAKHQNADTATGDLPATGSAMNTHAHGSPPTGPKARRSHDISIGVANQLQVADSAGGDFPEGFWDPAGPRPPVSPPPALMSSTTLRPVISAASSAPMPPSGTFQESAPIQTNQSHSSSGTQQKQWLMQNIECGELVQLGTDFQKILCTPEPDAFNPCEDIMGYPVLRVAVWLVVACSMFGNLSVIIVLLGIYRRLSVPKFLQLNLAIGDLFMGVYLAMLAGADIATVGTYFNYALDWQHGLGCRLAGASSLFASQLSIYTLIVITFERYYTITYSIDLNMRLQLGWASRIMLIGWLYAFVSAMLPIFANINSYSKTSICLPMRTIYKSDRIFILVLLIIDSCAFLIIFICYLRMYLLIVRQKTEASLKERTVAMRMALLVFTDFACWAPIIFFSSTALFGKPLISVTNSKILIVFFYPLNSMANPFLYVLSTRQYRRDLNYVVSRWRHWRKNLFKSDDKKDFSNNNYFSPYGPANCAGPNDNKYANLIAMNNLNAVAAMTGAASHLHGYRIPISDDHLDDGHRRKLARQVELVRVMHGERQQDCDKPECHYHNQNGHQRRSDHTHRHKHKYHRHCCRNQHHCKQASGTGAEAEHAIERPVAAQHIIRHQIIPGAALTRTTRTSRIISCDKTRSSEQQITSQRRVKLGLIVDAVDGQESTTRAIARADRLETSCEPRAVDGLEVNLNETNRVHREEVSKVVVSELRDHQDADGQDLQARGLCSCNKREQNRDANPTRSKSGGVNWSTRLNMRNRSRAQHRDSNSRSATLSTLVTGTTISSTNTCGGDGGCKSSNEPDPDTTATVDTTTSTNTATTTTSTTATSANSLDLNAGSAEPANDSRAARGDCRRHRHGHHHHRHHRHRDFHSRSRSRDNRDGEAKRKLERIVESSNTDRSSTPRQDQNHRDNHRPHRHHHHHHNHNHSHNHHRRHHHHGRLHQHECRSRDHLRQAKEKLDDNMREFPRRGSCDTLCCSSEFPSNEVRINSAQGGNVEQDFGRCALINRRQSTSDSNLQNGGGEISSQIGHITSRVEEPTMGNGV